MRSLVVFLALIGTPHALFGQISAESLPPPRRSTTMPHDDCCGQPVPTCGRPAPQPNCACQSCCRKRLIVVKQPCDDGGDENAPVNENAPAAGMFVAPPASGRVYSESGSRGITGLKIRFPELTLSLPSIELPSCFSFREKAHLRTNESVAPYMSVPTTTVAQYATSNGTRNESAPVDDEDESSNVKDELKSGVDKCEAQIQRLEQIEKRVSQQLLEMSKCLQQLNEQNQVRRTPPCTPSAEPILTPAPTQQCYPGRQTKYSVPVPVEPPTHRFHGELRRLPPISAY